MDDGSEMMIQSIQIPGAAVDTAGGKDKFKLEELADKTVKQVTKLAKGFKERMLSVDPDEFELEFSVGFSGGADLIVASSQLSTGLTFHLKWIKNK